MKIKKIIPCLDIKDGRTVKGVHFTGLKDAGDPVELARKYSESGADELVFLDISATLEKRKNLADLAGKVAEAIEIPFIIGGGIASEEDVENAISHGADKVAVNSAAVKNPDLINRIAETFGSQRLVIAVDGREADGEWRVCISGGTQLTDWKLLDWVREAERRGAGEILFTSMDHDGTKKGFPVEILKKIKTNTNLPVIASGGAGRKEDFLELFRQEAADAGLAASVFHFGEILIPELKEYLKDNGIQVNF